MIFPYNRRQLLVAYLLRIAAVFLFGFLVQYVLNAVRGEFRIYELLNIEFKGLTSVWSIILLILNFTLVLYFHELMHAALYYFSRWQKPRFGMLVLVIFAAALEKLISRNWMQINFCAP